ncbi:MAG: sugar ABC transporter substrate-binding protein [Sphaerochaetaceae bacterium]
MKKELRMGFVLLACFALLLSCTVDDGKSKSNTKTVANAPATTEVKAIEQTKTSEPAQKTLKVGFIATNLSAESQARVSKQFEKIGKEKGWNLTILNSQGSIETQATQMDNLVQMKVDAIVLAMGHPSEIKPSISAANKAGIPVITIASGYVDGVLTDITANDFVMGAKVTSYLFDSLGGKGNIVAIKFVKNAGCRKRGEVFDAILPEYPEIKLLDEYSVAATARFMDDTTSAMETFATKYGDKIDGVWCAFDQLAYSCADVLQAQGYKKALVVGVDGNEETFRRIENGTMAATVAQPFEEMANTASEIIEKIASGVSPEDAAGSHILYVDAPLETKTTLVN